MGLRIVYNAIVTYIRGRIKLMHRYLTHAEVIEAARNVTTCIPPGSTLYGVPRGGIPVAYLLAGMVEGARVVDELGEATHVVDDLVDSGATRRQYPDHPFIALYGKERIPADCSVGFQMGAEWLIFPWEQTVESSAEDICARLLQFIGEDPTREGLRETPKRFLKAWQFWTKGYREDPTELMKVFEDGAENCDEMVVVKDIPVYSHCEHHLAMIIGTATVAYIPNGKIIGLSKIARLVDVFARRLQVQERLTNQIADTLEEHLEPLGVGVVIKAQHMCMSSRGVEKQGAETVTQALRGVLKTDPAARAEFMGLAR
jgi:GTP cyclohydrolase I